MPSVETIGSDGGVIARDLLALDYKQNAVPSSPSAGDRWLRIDDATGAAIEPEAGAWWEYSGTYWLSEQIYISGRQSNFSTTNTNEFKSWCRGSHDLYLKTLEISHYTLTTLNSTNYWRTRIAYRNSADAETILSTFNTWQTGRTANTWYMDSTTINQHIDVSAVGLKVGNLPIAAVGSPGGLSFEVKLYYKLARG